MRRPVFPAMARRLALALLALAPALPGATAAQTPSPAQAAQTPSPPQAAQTPLLPAAQTLPPPAAQAPSAPQRMAARITESEGTTRATAVGDSLWDIVVAATAGTAIDRNQAMVAILRRNPGAFPTGNLHRIERNQLLAIPSLREMRAEDPRRAAALVAQHGLAYADRSLAPMPLYALAASGPAGAAALLPRPPTADRAGAGQAQHGAEGAMRPEAPAAPDVPAPPAPDVPGPAPATEPIAAAAPRTSTPTAHGVPWLPVGVLGALGLCGIWLLARRRSVPDLGAADAALDAELASRAFADSRLALEQQLDSQLDSLLHGRDSRLGEAGGLGVPSQPLYGSFDDEDGVPAPAVADVSRPPRATVPLVIRAGAPAPTAGPAGAASGEALALALTLAHAYADVGRGDAARAWLRAIDSHGGVSF